MRFSFIALLFLIIGCKEADDKASTDITGTYKMLSVNVKTDKLDTVYLDPRQMKIYTGDYMMYATVNPADSVGGFGIGTYTVDKDTITETVIYSSSDTVASDKPEIYKLAITKTDSGYKQLIAGMVDNRDGTKFNLTEDYQSVGTGTSTPLDGAWKMSELYWIKGTDTTRSPVLGTQYKTYFQGHCIWGNAWKDSLNKIHTGIGYGKFTMSGDNKVKESMIASTYADVTGHDFDIDIELLGKDGFRQTHKHVDSSRTVEVYQKLKK